MATLSDGTGTRWATRIIAAAVVFVGACAATPDAAVRDTEDRNAEDGEILLIVRSDDMGAAHAINQACLLSVTEGIARSIEVIVPNNEYTEYREKNYAPLYNAARSL